MSLKDSMILLLFPPFPRRFRHPQVGKQHHWRNCNTNEKNNSELLSWCETKTMHHCCNSDNIYSRTKASCFFIMMFYHCTNWYRMSFLQLKRKKIEIKQNSSFETCVSINHPSKGFEQFLIVIYQFSRMAHHEIDRIYGSLHHESHLDLVRKLFTKQNVVLPLENWFDMRKRNICSKIQSFTVLPSSHSVSITIS